MSTSPVTPTRPARPLFSPASPCTPPRFNQPVFAPGSSSNSPIVPDPDARFVFPAFESDTEMDPVEIITQGTQGFSTPVKPTKKRNFTLDSPESPNRVNTFVENMGLWTPPKRQAQAPAFSPVNTGPQKPLFDEDDESVFRPDLDFFREVRTCTKTKEKSTKKAAPSAPMKAGPISAKARAKMENGQDLWDTFPVSYKELGKTEAGDREGNFHRVFLLLPGNVRPEHVRYMLKNPDGTLKPTVVKIPNEEAIKKNRCFINTENAHKNYLDLSRDKAKGKLPKGLDLAETHFYEEEGIITQELWDLPFDPVEDMQQPEVVATVKEMLHKIANREVSRADFKADNLGWKDGKLKLFDFIEEAEYDPEYNMEQFTGSFALDSAMYYYLNPNKQQSVETKQA